MCGGDTIKIGNNTISVYDSPCHTSGHVLFTAGNGIFTGDTMFSGGCGKFFEGNAGEMYHNLYETIGTMANNTIIFPGHEYTLSNMEFVQWCEPDNNDIKHNYQYAQSRRTNNLPVIPTTLEYEKKINTFLRVNQSNVSTQIIKLMGVNPNELSRDRKQREIQLLKFVRQMKDENKHKTSKM